MGGGVAGSTARDSWATVATPSGGGAEGAVDGGTSLLGRSGGLSFMGNPSPSQRACVVERNATPPMICAHLLLPFPFYALRAGNDRGGGHLPDPGRTAATRVPRIMPR